MLTCCILPACNKRAVGGSLFIVRVIFCVVFQMTVTSFILNHVLGERFPFGNIHIYVYIYMFIVRVIFLCQVSNDRFHSE